MYTATLKGDVIDREKSRRIITVEFTNGTTTFLRDFQFRVEEDPTVIKRTVTAALNELNATPAPLTDLTPPTDTPPAAPTQAELERNEWLADWKKLEAVKRLIDNGVLTGTETAVTNLRTKTRTSFKIAYLDLL